jgi:hypothetical protein
MQQIGHFINLYFLFLAGSFGFMTGVSMDSKPDGMFFVML